MLPKNLKNKNNIISQSSIIKKIFFTIVEYRRLNLFLRDFIARLKLLIKVIRLSCAYKKIGNI